MHSYQLKANCQTKNAIFYLSQQNVCSGNACSKDVYSKEAYSKNRQIPLHILYITLSKAYQVSKHYITGVRNFLSVKFQRVNIFFFACHVVSIKTTQLCCCGVEAAIENMFINRQDWVLTKHFYQSELELDSICGTLFATLPDANIFKFKINMILSEKYYKIVTVLMATLK